MPNTKYFHELTLKEMFEHHDHTYQMSDDHRYYKNGRYQVDIIEDKVAENGGWTEELVNEWNKYAPNDTQFQKDFEWIKKFKK